MLKHTEGTVFSLPSSSILSKGISSETNVQAPCGPPAPSPFDCCVLVFCLGLASLPRRLPRDAVPRGDVVLALIVRLLDLTEAAQLDVVVLGLWGGVARRTPASPSIAENPASASPPKPLHPRRRLLRLDRIDAPRRGRARASPARRRVRIAATRASRRCGCIKVRPPRRNNRRRHFLRHPAASMIVGGTSPAVEGGVEGVGGEQGGRLGVRRRCTERTLKTPCFGPAGGQTAAPAPNPQLTSTTGMYQR